MKKFLVELFYGYQDQSVTPYKKYCNKQCQGFNSRHWYEKKVRQPGPYLTSESPLWATASRTQTRQGYIQLIARDPKIGAIYWKMERGLGARSQPSGT
ncbi:hypothetical protein [Geobacter grbiciae]|uniref:hypothetical protein n=1 Tax=Geobacter grbiciae TaxID=155042 RepID=UPI001C013E6F|nr:hypothetical protein [Geobacter grbiciae]MBT1073969.1 hypothetical protein [Geobacter grbiciae]